MITLLHGDCLEQLKTLPDNSVDSVVTDPPYELGFMGKSWDKSGIANNVEMWKECLRVLKPGGHLLAFSGARTYHRMASAIEDAGFEVRDMIEWVYGSGFPKSLNIAKQLDKKEGVEHLKNTPISDNGLMSGANYTRNKMDVQSDLAKEWEGWGTALKPAHEPICMARKPLSEKTVAENCLKWGTGGINIDESRVGTEKVHITGGGGGMGTGWGKKEAINEERTGRFPANLIHDNSEEVRECFPETGNGNGKGAYNYAGKEYNNKDTSMFNGDKPQAPSNFNDSGNASRYFKSILYVPKASKRERNMGCEGLEEKETKRYGDFEGTPEHAPICMARKPLSEKNVAENCLKWGTGGINIDESRVENTGKSTLRPLGKSAYQKGGGIVNGGVAGTYEVESEFGGGHEGGRFPANLIHDNSEEVRECFPETKTGNLNKTNTSIWGNSGGLDNIQHKGSSGNASRFFKSILYVPKASKRERNMGCEGLEEKETKRYGDFEGTPEHAPKLNVKNTNNHPTVKPVALMEYLIKMVTRKGGTVLDPFMGSGSTGIACKKNGYNFIGIEREEEYIKIAKARINNT